MAGLDLKDHNGIGISLVVVVAALAIGGVSLFTHPVKKADAEATASASASSEASYPEATTDADGTVEIAAPTANPNTEANVPSQSDETASIGSTTAYVVQEDPQTAISEYLVGSGLVDDVESGNSWVDINLNSHTDINEKFANMHTLQTTGTWKSDVKFGDVTYAKGSEADITAYIAYDQSTNTTTIHTLVVNTVSFIADGYVDDSMYGYMFS